MSSGVWLITDGARPHSPPQPSAAQGFAAPPYTPGPPTAVAPSPPPDPLPPSPPVRVRVPAIEVDAPVMKLGLTSDGSLEVPPERRKNLVGWYGDGTAPGAAGTALVAGHVDNHQGPAAFYSLGSLKKGNTVEIRREDGRTAVFSIDAVEVYDGAGFPDKKVYGPARRPELRLITCGGGFDKARQEYLGNVVVFAHLTGTK
ncbi:class F sortase [Streptomyces sp. MST-110588]|uniref:class F sortase n=1 Tax=Streptomyces sp. MST-110588 TaxID=2833628 RepID=UPI001F5D7AAB|nr:class F sortase [Streptomyces sp. MST-110588]UNO42743.1 class F sortase [Streptomyces sp. MST-110588]